MKSILVHLVALMALPCYGGPLKLQAVKKVVVGVTEAFLPSGFDSQADQIVVVNGYFPNGCYSLDTVKVNHGGEFDHEVSVIANVQQGLCTMAIIPFQKEISLGKLTTGKHKLVFPSSDGTSIEKYFLVE